MKSPRAALSGIEVHHLSIPDAEAIIEEALNELSYSQDPGLTRALQFLAPPGYQAIVELCSENGRSKRRNASSASWTPEDDEVRIYFERADESEAAPKMARVPRAVPDAHDDEEDDGQQELLGADMDARSRDRDQDRNQDHNQDRNQDRIQEHIRELCGALAEAERGGHAFIALKWFRDSFLPRKSYRWNQHPESRQAVLAEAIQRGVILTSKIANPKSPAYPTTTIRLNRAEAGIPEEAQRFHPVAVQGGALAEAIEEERSAE